MLIFDTDLARLFAAWLDKESDQLLADTQGVLSKMNNFRKSWQDSNYDFYLNELEQLELKISYACFELKSDADSLRKRADIVDDYFHRT